MSALAILLAGCLAAAPIYIFPSGLPQPADWLLALLVALMALSQCLPARPAMYWPAAIWVYWVAQVGLVWYLFTESDWTLRPAIFQLYNVSVMIAVAVIVAQEGAKSLRIGLIAGQTVVLMGIALDTGFRATAWFNNPNQLGYWSICGATLWVFARRPGQIRLIDLLVFASCGAGAIASLSKAAIISYSVFMLIALWRIGMSPSYRIAGVLIGLVALTIVATQPAIDLSGTPLSRAYDRVASIGEQQDDNLAARGYDRISRYPQYIFLGAGEGGIARFGGQLEIHSTLGTVLFSYGLVGLAVFCWLIWRMVGSWSNLFWLAPMALYSLAHNGLRFTVAWIVIGAIAGSRDLNRERTLLDRTPEAS